jgi:hypothetical protein
MNEYVKNNICTLRHIVQIFFLGLSILAVLPITAGGDDGTKTNLTSSQYFYAFPFGDGSTQIAAGPGVSDLAAHVNKCVCYPNRRLLH